MAFKLYLENTDPLKWDILKNFLKHTYEAIPKAQRHLVIGDMDYRDGPIRDVIYDEHNAMSWSYEKYIANGGDLFIPDFDELYRNIGPTMQSGIEGPSIYIKDQNMFSEAVKLAKQFTSLRIIDIMRHFKISFARAVELAKELKMARIIDYEIKYT